MRFILFWFLTSNYVLINFTSEGNAAGTSDKNKNAGGAAFKGQAKISTKAQQKCLAYTMEACNRTLMMEAVNHSADIRMLKKRSVDANGKVVVTGGRNALPREYPHMALIGFGDYSNVKWQSGGSLISEKYVLSAAHCSTASDSPARWVRLGELDLSTEKDDAETKDFSITKIITHPEYKSPGAYNDIALFKLNASVKAYSYVRPICLNFRHDWIFDKVIAMGWGSTAYGETGSTMLQTVVFNVQPNEKCKEVYKNNNRLKNGFNASTMICAGHSPGGKDTCQGDSGGPLIVEMKNDCQQLYIQIGIISFGLGCALKDTPAVYTRISFYIPWIESIVWK